MKQQCLLLALLLGVAAANYNDPRCRDGRSVVVHLFNWKWTDIAAECERFLGPKGYCGVQVSPPNEHRIVGGRPWWERYQPVSYKLESRSGNRGQFIDMVNRCNAVGVIIYVDAVINHMCGADAGEGTGTGGSYYNTGSQDFSGVPFSAFDFNQCGCGACCSGSCGIESYNDANQVRNCRLVGLLDLALGNNYVRGKVIDYMKDLTNIGVAGFRVDAVKHMWPGDLQAIYGSVGDVFYANEVIDLGGEAVGVGDYLHLGRVTEFRYCNFMGQAFRKHFPLRDLRTFGSSWGMMADGSAFVFVDNHDNQRGHGAGGDIILTYQESRIYKMATAFALAWPYGFARIMSSYDFGSDTDVGPPSNGDEIASVPINADDSCGGGWICEHRWRQIYNMAAFRNVAGGTGVDNWWDNGSHQIAFSRGNRAFIAITNEGNLNASLQTGLSPGNYCDIISGNKNGNSCSGKTITVNGDGTANINIGGGDEDPMVAIHADSKV
uniref:alpha-amylase n=1 Tax=Platynereis dumerilii TaxID=6359 RepID=A0A0A7MAB5_PLADU|nr:alpha-amylase [Platynereis dumerilii]